MIVEKKWDSYDSATGLIAWVRFLPGTPLWDHLKVNSLRNEANLHIGKIGMSKAKKEWIVGAEQGENWVNWM